MKRVLTLVALVAMVAWVSDAGVKAVKQLRNDDGKEVVSSVSKGTVASAKKTGALTWVSVDSCNNAFGQSAGDIKPLAYDPYIDQIALIHRGRTTYAAASGQLWYNVSTDQGATWRRVSELNAGVGNNGRYPSAAIANGSHATVTDNVKFIYAAPKLDGPGAGFGGILYGVDFPIGAGAPTAFKAITTDSSYGSSTSIWADDATDDIYWLATANDGMHFFSTVDYVTINETVPTGWGTADFVTFGQYSGSSKARGGNPYVGVYASWTGDDQADWNLGYSKSADKGATWGAWQRPVNTWREYAPFNTNMFLEGTAYGRNVDMLVDKDGKVHFLAAAQDTLTKRYSVIEIYEGASGWAGKTVANVNPSTYLNYTDLPQTGWAIHAAASPDGSVLSVVWLNAATQAEGDTMPDIWLASRKIDAPEWSTPVNLTQTPDLFEISLHMAPVLKANGGDSYTAFLSRSWQIGAVPPVVPAATPASEMFVASYTFTAGASAVGDQPTVAAKFSLAQNYPNPFNPSTRVEYSIPTGSLVTIKVFDILGREVATLVNEQKAAGSYTATFDASNLANGTYIYKIQAGNFTDTKKMTLLK